MHVDIGRAYSLLDFLFVHSQHNSLQSSGPTNWWQKRRMPMLEIYYYMCGELIRASDGNTFTKQRSGEGALLAWEDENTCSSIYRSVKMLETICKKANLNDLAHLRERGNWERSRGWKRRQREKVFSRALWFFQVNELMGSVFWSTLPNNQPLDLNVQDLQNLVVQITWFDGSITFHKWKGFEGLEKLFG